MRNISKFILKMMILMASISVFESTVKYLYEPIKNGAQYATAELEDKKGEIEVLLCGTSTTQRGFHKDTFEKYYPGKYFNLATSGQTLVGTYELLRDVASVNPIKKVYFGLSVEVMLEGNEFDISRRQLVYDTISSVEGKMSYLINGCDVSEWESMIFFSRRVEDYSDFDLVEKNVKYKGTEKYENYICPRDSYIGSGFWKCTGTYKGKTFDTIEKKDETLLSQNTFDKKSMYYLEKSIQYCLKNDIDIYLIYIPITGKLINNYGNYEEIHDVYAEIAEKYDVPLLDFNYYKNLKTDFSNTSFDDYKHLNQVGAQILSEKVIEFDNLITKGESVAGYFLNECPYYITNKAEKDSKKNKENK